MTEMSLVSDLSLEGNEKKRIDQRRIVSESQ